MAAMRVLDWKLLAILLPLLASACGSDNTTSGSGTGGTAAASTGGDQAWSGGAATGGSAAAGATTPGGGTASGGAGATSGTGGTTAGVGGQTTSGGAQTTGGQATSGGSPAGGASGGTSPAGGGAQTGGQGGSTGGTSGSGGAVTGGMTGDGGALTGGATGDGGAPTGGDGGTATGGDTGTGGSTDQEWLPSWGTSCQKTEANNVPSTSLSNATLRQFIWPTYSGSQIRLELSNQRGSGSLVVNKVHIAMAANNGQNGAIDTSTDKEFSFSGSPNVTVAAGKTAWSDALDFPVEKMKLTAITMQIQSVPSEITGHPGARTTSYIATGDSLTQGTMSGETRPRWYFINTLEVMAPADAFAVCLLGDSITDGYGVKEAENEFGRWSDFLTIEIDKDPSVKDKVSVINAGMGANKLLTGGDQDPGTVRYERDCVGRPMVKWDIILIGVNDIQNAGSTGLADQITGAYQSMIQKGRTAGHKVFGSPITPFKGKTDYDGNSALDVRRLINEWVRTPNNFDAVVDLSAAVADPNDKEQLANAYRRIDGDLLHPSVAGYEAMGKAVDLTLFTP